MPLMQGKSKKAFSKNVETEMNAGKPQDQSLAIAYSVKRKNKNKKAYGGKMYAEGGPISAKEEKRPMPEDRHNDAQDVRQADHSKSNGPDGWTDNPTVAQAQSNNGREVKKIKYPRMVPSNAFSTRMRDEEDDLQSSKAPGPYGAQPPAVDNEEDAASSGHPVRDMADQHNNGRKPYSKAIEDQYSQDVAEADMKRSQSYAAGGMVVDEDRNERRERSDEAHLESGASPSEDEGSSDARSRDEEGPDRQGPAISDNEEPHSEHDRMYADNEHSQADDLNPAHDKHSADDSEEQPEDESQMMHEASIAAAIMSKRRKFARGGAILSEDSMEATDDDQADLNRNAEEDANMEDKASFDALRKENYDEEYSLDRADNPLDAAMHGDEEEMDSENKHDRSLVGKIRSSMKKRSPISR